MAEKIKIGLTEIRAMLPGETLSDSVLSGFVARRQKGPDVALLHESG